MAETAHGVREVITVATCLWDANAFSHPFSRCYDDSWADKLYRGFKRNLTLPFRFVVFTDRERKFRESVEQMPILRRPIHYGACVEPFALNVPLIFVGLDTIVVGNVDKLARWCLQNRGKLALPKHPYEPWSINGVVLWGGGNPAIFGNWAGENDMDWMRSFEHQRIDDLFPRKVVSYKAHVTRHGLHKARIVYFHGQPKPPELMHLPWVRECWR